MLKSSNTPSVHHLVLGQEERPSLQFMLSSLSFEKYSRYRKFGLDIFLNRRLLKSNYLDCIHQPTSAGLIEYYCLPNAERIGENFIIQDFQENTCSQSSASNYARALSEMSGAAVYLINTGELPTSCAVDQLDLVIRFSSELTNEKIDVESVTFIFFGLDLKLIIGLLWKLIENDRKPPRSVILLSPIFRHSKIDDYPPQLEDLIASILNLKSEREINGNNISKFLREHASTLDRIKYYPPILIQSGSKNADINAAHVLSFVCNCASATLSWQESVNLPYSYHKIAPHSPEVLDSIRRLLRFNRAQAYADHRF